jgi:hypothetical protein
LTADADEDRMADFCIAAIQGAMLMGKIKRNPQPVEAAVRETLAHLRRYVMPLGSESRRRIAVPAVAPMRKPGKRAAGRRPWQS